MKKMLQKLIGVDQLEQKVRELFTQLANEMLDELRAQIEEVVIDKIVAEQEAEEAKEKARLAKLSPKELATERGEPYISVSEVKVNKDNVRNGFFELDWNDQFVLDLKQQGYTGATQEEIVDQWFQDLCRNVGSEQGVDMERRGSGYVNFNRIDDERSEVS